MHFRFIAVLFVSFFLTACGGAGGSSSNDTPPEDNSGSGDSGSGDSGSGDSGSGDSGSGDSGSGDSGSGDSGSGDSGSGDSGSGDSGSGDSGSGDSGSGDSGSGDTGSGGNNPGDSGSDDPEFSTNDPLLKHQWYLFNYGQTALTSSNKAGTSGEDIQAFTGNKLTPENYAKGHTGEGVEIAIIDSGMEINHDDLAPNVIADGSYNLSYPGNGKGQHDVTSSGSDGDHGTSVAGLAAARGGNGEGIWGTAPYAKLRGYNLLKSQSFVAELAVLGHPDAVETFDGMKVDTVSVFNKSYGRNPVVVESVSSTTVGMQALSTLDVMQYGVENLREGKGAIYVKAAGNEYADLQSQSAGWCNEANAKGVTCYNANQEVENTTPYQMVIGAFNADGKRSSYSNTSSALWMVAPGGEFGTNSPALVSTDVSGCFNGYSRATDFNLSQFDRGFEIDNFDCDYYSAFNGTSAAPPVASGAAAVLLQANPNLSWRDVKHIFAMTARQLQADLAEVTLDIDDSTVTLEQGWVENGAGHSFSNEFGFGAIHLTNAVAMAQTWKTESKTLPDFVTKTVDEQTFSSDNTIPSGKAAGLSQSQSVSESMTVESVLIEMDITALTSDKIDPSDYQIELTSPAGTKSILLTAFNAYQSGNQMEGLRLISHAFYGESASGNWTVTIRDLDDSANNRITHKGEGKLDSFQLTFYGHEPS